MVSNARIGHRGDSRQLVQAAYYLCILANPNIRTGRATRNQVGVWKPVLTSDLQKNYSLQSLQLAEVPDSFPIEYLPKPASGPVTWLCNP